MSNTLAKQVVTALARYSGTSRLYTFSLDDDRGRFDADELLVEAFAALDAVDDVGARDIIVLSLDARVEPTSLLGKPASLDMTLADGSRARFSGEISEVAMLGSDGGFGRYRVRISPWLWRLGLVRNSRVWEDQTVIQIIDSVFDSYQPVASWRWSMETKRFMDAAVPRSYCCQYRESDLDFMRRLLAEEGLSWRFEQTGEGPGLVLFSDSSQPSAVPEDPSSELDGSIRYHAASTVEGQDTVQTLTEQRRMQVSFTTLLSPDYKSKRVVAASSPSLIRHPAGLPALESYDSPGQYAYANRDQARRYADLQMQGREARTRLWRGRSTVRSLRAGTRLVVNGMPRQQSGSAVAFTVLRVTSIGVNNLPPPARHALAELFGPIPALLEDCTLGYRADGLELAIEQASELGYANCFEAIPVEFTWRPQLAGSAGRTRPKPTASGAQSAIVVGPDGGDTQHGTDELYCDRLGRVRIRFHWQDGGAASCWVRVAQRSAGGGMGSQFLPRIGQEVLVQFLENDIDRPIVVGALYNGQGEGGFAPTPGGRRDAGNQASVFEQANDHAPSGQGNLAGGNSPAWHGASGSSAGHRNKAAQWGIRSKEFGGAGYNQLLFDDTDAQGRVQLKSTHASSELNLGHLIHAADNYRGSFRGLGAELRTDAYGAVRAGSGLLVSSYGIAHSATQRDPAGENAGGVGILRQAVESARIFNSACATHLTVALAAHLGAATANASAVDGEAAPLAGMLKALAGEVASDGSASLPHSSAALLAIAAKDGFAATAGQSLQLANGETVTLMSGQDMQFVVGGQLRMQTRQAIGVLGGSVKPGDGGVGLQMIAAKDAVDIQAQGDALTVQARDAIDVISAHAHIDWAAAKRISLSTAGGANITIEGGNITVQCPGKIVVRAGKKSFAGPDRLTYELPALPGSVCIECLKKSLEAGPAFTMVE